MCEVDKEVLPANKIHKLMTSIAECNHGRPQVLLFIMSDGSSSVVSELGYSVYPWLWGLLFDLIRQQLIIWQPPP